MGRRDSTLARVTGELYFDSDIRLVVREYLVYRSLPVAIDWYDSQPHPSDPAPHHKHIHPGIKHHRIPAPEMSFTKPNFPALIHEIEALINEIKGQPGE